MNGWNRLFFFTCALWFGFLLTMCGLFFGGVHSWPGFFGLGTVPMCVVYAIGHGVAWVRRGFREVPQTKEPTKIGNVLKYYWTWFIISNAAFIAASLNDYSLAIDWLALACSVAFFLAAASRAQDLGRSRWWALAATIIPLIGIWLGCERARKDGPGLRVADAKGTPLRFNPRGST